MTIIRGVIVCAALSVAAFVLAMTGYAAEEQGAKPASNHPSAADKRAQDDFARQISCGVGHVGPPDALQLNTAFVELDRQLPNIPPEEADYLQREDTALLPQPASATKMSRYAALVSRPLYYAWKARRAFDRANIAVKAVYDPDHIPSGDWGSLQTLGVQLVPNPLRDEKADRIYRFIVSVAPVADAAAEITDFLNRDAWNANHLMTEQQRADVRLKIFAVPHYLEATLSCHFVSYVLDRRK